MAPIATITSASELMTNCAAAAAIPSSSHLVALFDEYDKPMVFCLSEIRDSTNTKLQVIKEDDDGNRFITDLADALGLASAIKITTFDVKQAPDKRVFLAFAVESAAEESLLYIVKPFRVLTELLLSDNFRLQYVASPKDKMGQVYEIFMGSNPSYGFQSH
ncbi:MAG: hypothetical protein Q9180_001693 [Flavoplaca navasiana]